MANSFSHGQGPWGCLVDLVAGKSKVLNATKAGLRGIPATRLGPMRQLQLYADGGYSTWRLRTRRA